MVSYSLFLLFFLSLYLASLLVPIFGYSAFNTTMFISFAAPNDFDGIESFCELHIQPKNISDNITVELLQHTLGALQCYLNESQCDVYCTQHIHTDQLTRDTYINWRKKKKNSEHRTSFTMFNLSSEPFCALYSLRIRKSWGWLYWIERRKKCWTHSQNRDCCHFPHLMAIKYRCAVFTDTVSFTL